MRVARAPVAGVLVAAVLASLTLLVAPPAPAVSAGPGGTGSFTSAWYPAAGAPGAREYWLYVPADPRAKMPVVVYLHGCTQTALDAAIETQFNVLADRQHFIVVYPQQTDTSPRSAPLADGNGAACWNWFLPEDQVRGQGEAGTIAGLTRYVVAAEQADAARVYVDGISAGADMAVDLGATYPDMYAAIGVLAGCPFATCSDLTGSLAYQAMGAHHRVMPVFVEQGTADTLNLYPLGAAAVQQWVGTDDLADDSSLDGSISRVPVSTTNYGFDQTPSPGSGDTCVQHSNFPCPGGIIGFQGTYPYTVQKWDDSHGCDLIDLWTIHGLEHAYPGAPTDATFSDPLGPDITTAAWEFFSAHPMGGDC